MSSTSESDEPQREAAARLAVSSPKHEKRAAKGESKRAMKDAKQAYRATVREAKNRFKADCTAAKMVMKSIQKTQKENAKAAKKAVKHRERTPQETETQIDDVKTMNTETMDRTFPLVLADGRQLQISWNKGDLPEEVARQFAEQHGIQADGIPAILGFIQHCNAHANAHENALEETAPGKPACDKMESSEAVPNTAAYTFRDEGQLRALETMGFANHEVNVQLLTAHNGNIESVLEQLL